ncbi:FadR/GntR family transcriptional regulator [uncultured Oscillibacter sp.]|jgi:GntR family transcriptional repressor for pyruvate dehydrogenase complex|uniref:FadR/GntR family transcriptional regulator n=3 Tax=uncultured Oscillibacter sp. TaxID=876091 RepID=UPI00216D12B3|nr:FadR/GntR family transcriptional regulator [uncultured Oscillibacter sp.]MCI9554537.1 FadR family transcriptional regulator [Oscillibacter sp.]
MEGKRAKLSEQTADRLYEWIVEERRYPPGSKLPNENELSESMGVSRTTLREAISFLVAQGVLDIRRGKGTFVAESLPNPGMDLTALAGVRSRVRAKDLFEMRLIFEPATVALACRRASDEELEQIRKKAERVERIAAEGGNWPLADQEFHWAIIKASHNEYMRRLYPIINSAVDEILQISPSRQRMQDIALGDNRTILAFLLKRDEEGARCAMSIHMKHLINTLQD